MSESEYQIRFYKDIDDESNYIVVTNESLLKEFKKELVQTGTVEDSFFLKKYLQAYFGTSIPLADVQDNSFIVIYNFNLYSDEYVSIHEKKLRIA